MECLIKSRFQLLRSSLMAGTQNSAICVDFGHALGVLDMVGLIE